MKRDINLLPLQGLVDWLPVDPEEWTTKRRLQLLEAFAVVLDYVHPIPRDKP